MKKWSAEREIQAPIEDVWPLFDESVEAMRKTMPNVIKHEPVTVTEEKVGSIYRQTYGEGKRKMEYDVETLDYKDSPEEKKVKVGFTLNNMFDITTTYELFKIDEQTTLFRYTTTNQPLRWYIKPFVVLASKRVVVQYADRVKAVAEVETETKETTETPGN
ncbi:SRPBCC family protein [Salsuginibacillus kocurii]|uniref:SRPBCC family protein n=1 Tax=Salsuginibacillus kocurii TaxID=427078 RepID=UPI0003662D43|nr:SRPBCC family protein [Salsuginibacillus kocurii]